MIYQCFSEIQSLPSVILVTFFQIVFYRPENFVYSSAYLLKSCNDRAFAAICIPFKILKEVPFSTARVNIETCFPHRLFQRWAFRNLKRKALVAQLPHVRKLRSTLIIFSHCASCAALQGK